MMFGILIRKPLSTRYFSGGIMHQILEGLSCSIDGVAVAREGDSIHFLTTIIINLGSNGSINRIIIYHIIILQK